MPQATVEQQHGLQDIERVTVNVDTAAMLSRAEIDQQVATAHAFPRSLTRFRTESLAMVTHTRGIAEECNYALPRDGKTIEGPSARFAEIIASTWGNCRAAARIVGEQEEFVVAQGAFHDLERNVAITYEVKRRITDKHGRRYKPDMIGVTANAACSIALRNAILKGVPKAFWDDIYEAARNTIKGNTATLEARRSEMISYFTKLGVTEAMICQALGVSGVKDIDLDHIVTLRGIATAIREGDSTVEEAFSAKNTDPGPQQKTNNAPPMSQQEIEQRARIHELHLKLGLNQAKESMNAGKFQGRLNDLEMMLAELIDARADSAETGASTEPEPSPKQETPKTEASKTGSQGNSASRGAPWPQS